MGVLLTVICILVISFGFPPELYLILVDVLHNFFRLSWRRKLSYRDMYQSILWKAARAILEKIIHFVRPPWVNAIQTFTYEGNLWSELMVQGWSKVEFVISPFFRNHILCWTDLACPYRIRICISLATERPKPRRCEWGACWLLGATRYCPNELRLGLGDASVGMKSESDWLFRDIFSSAIVKSRSSQLAVKVSMLWIWSHSYLKVPPEV